MLALLAALVIWQPGVTLWLCNPGHGPFGAPSNCEHVHFVKLATFPRVSADGRKR